MRIAFLINPTANRNALPPEALPWVKKIRQEFPEAQVRYSESAGHLTELARSLVGKVDACVACGGDGSLNKVILGLRHTPMILGLIPTGTGNDFAKSVGIHLQPEKALDQLKTARVGAIDVLEYHTQGSSGIFHNTLGIGFDGLANHFAAKLPFKQGRLRYPVSALQALYRQDAFEVSLQIDDNSIKSKVFMVTLANGAVEGGQFIIAPQAKPDDGWLEVLVIRKSSKLQLLVLLPFLLLRKRPTFAMMEYHRCKRIHFESDRKVAVHADGEQLGQDISSLSAQLAPQQLPFLIPSNPTQLG